MGTGMAACVLADRMESESPAVVYKHCCVPEAETRDPRGWALKIRPCRGAAGASRHAEVQRIEHASFGMVSLRRYGIARYSLPSAIQTSVRESLAGLTRSSDVAEIDRAGADAV